jgi:hypothetical protein
MRYAYLMETETSNTAIRVYLPEIFVQDACEADPDMWPLWDRILHLPRVRRGGGFGYWADLTADEARLIRKEAEYRAEYWLTDAYGVREAGGVSSHERSRGNAARRVAEFLNA